MDISPLITPTVDRKELARALDDVNEETRIKAVMELRGRDLATLFEGVADNEPLRLDDFVPRETPPLTEIIHEGKNSLPTFSRFQKRFCLPAQPTDRPELWGYNHQTFRWFTGPGYFVAKINADGLMLIDYTSVPEGRPSHWPPVIPNSARLGRFVYYGTSDVMRRVSRFVTVGRALKGERPMNAWFVLVRREHANPRT